MGDKTTPNPFFWPILTPGVVLCHLGVGLSPLLQGWVYPPLCRGGFIPPKGWFYPPIWSLGGGFITPLGWFYPPFLVILSPYWPGGGGLAHLNVNQEPGCLTPPPPVPRNRLVQKRPLVPRLNSRTTFFTTRYWVFHGSGGCRTAIQVCRTSFHVCCYGSPHQGEPYQSPTGAHPP